MKADRSGPIILGCFAVIGVLAVFVIVLCAGIHYGLSSGMLASTEALPKGEIPQRQLDEISEIIGLRPREELLYFYSAGLTVASDGNLFTNERVVSYTADYGPLEVYDAEYSEIEDAILVRGASWLEDSTLSVYLKDSTVLTLWVSAENNRDQDFYDKLMIELTRSRAEVGAGADELETRGGLLAPVPAPPEEGRRGEGE